MGSFRSIAYSLAIISMGWKTVCAEELSSDDTATINHREPRHLKEKLCFKLGICGGGFNQGYGGHQGGYQGGHQGGSQGYPPINIGISQSQSSSSAGGGGFGSGYIPNNYQYNGYPGQNHNGYNGYHGQYNNGYHGQYNNGYPGQFTNGHNRPGSFGNGIGSYNNQFNGNYYGERPQGGGYGFQTPFGNFYDEGASRSAKSKTRN